MYTPQMIQKTVSGNSEEIAQIANKIVDSSNRMIFDPKAFQSEDWVTQKRYYSRPKNKPSANGKNCEIPPKKLVVE